MQSRTAQWDSSVVYIPGLQELQPIQDLLFDLVHPDKKHKFKKKMNSNKSLLYNKYYL